MSVDISESREGEVSMATDDNTQKTTSDQIIEDEEDWDKDLIPVTTQFGIYQPSLYICI